MDHQAGAFLAKRGFARRRWVALLAAHVVFFGSAVVMANPHAARLIHSRTQAALTCPDEAALREAVKSRLGYDVLFPAATLTIISRFDRTADGTFTATIQVIDEGGIARGARELRDKNCDALLAATALNISIAIDPQSLFRPPTPKPDVRITSVEIPPQADATPSLASPPTLKPTVATPPSVIARRSRLHLSLSAGTLLASGQGPALGLGGAAGFELAWTKWSLGAEVQWVAPSSEPATGGGRIGAWLLRGVFLPCAVVSPVTVCGVFEAGAMEARSTYVLVPRSDAAPWLAAGLRLGVQWPISRGWAIRVHSDVVANLAPIHLKLNDRVAWESRPIASTLGIDAVVHF